MLMLLCMCAVHVYDVREADAINVVKDSGLLNEKQHRQVRIVLVR